VCPRNPYSRISPSVRTTGALGGATVEILANGNPIGHTTAANPGEVLVPLTKQPAVHDMISGRQTTSEGTSDPSAQATQVEVVPVPDPLPVPVIRSALNTCMADILVDGLVPGAKVVTTSLQPNGTNGPGGTEPYAKPRLLIHPLVFSETLTNFPTRLVNTRQRLLRPIERRFPHHTFPSRRSRCGSSVCQDWTKSNSVNLSTA